MSQSRSVLIVEDDPIYARRLAEVVRELGFTLLGVEANLPEAIASARMQNPDVVIGPARIASDVQVLELAKTLQDSNVPLILTADKPDEATFEQVATAQPSTLIVNPFDPQALKGAIAISDLNPVRTGSDASYLSQGETLQDTVFVKSGNLIYKVRLPEVLFVHAEGNYCTIVSTSKRIAVKMSLPQVLDTLRTDDFVQVHRNYVVRLSEIDSVSLSHNELMIHGYTIPISRTKFREDLLRSMKLLK
jgi:DNA-binding LytR/AlgR family response regulator